MDASYDLVGLYTRTHGEVLQIRLDLLDMPQDPNCDLYLALDFGNGKQTALPVLVQPAPIWDVLLVAPAAGDAYAIDNSGKPIEGLLLSVYRDPTVSMVVFNLNMHHLSEKTKLFNLQAFAAPTGMSLPSSQIGPLRSDATPLSGKARMLLEFWNTLPADSPAQALRRWDGAHTGPLGERHGLRLLLQAVERNGIPVTLLDLKKPQSLSALDVVGGIELVKRLLSEQLLVLPDVAWGDPSTEQGLELSRKTAAAFGLPDSPLLFLGGTGVTLDPSREPTRQGLALSLRRDLLTKAMGQDTGILVEGGDLPNSTWGDSLAVMNAMLYLANHPWVHMLGGKDVLALPACSGGGCLPGGLSLCPAALCQPAVGQQPGPILTELLKSPPGSITDLAWQTYLQLSDPLASVDLQHLRSNYMGQVSLLIAAARWAAAPYVRSDCSTDLDGDGQLECILASNDFFGVLKMDGARLVLGFVRTRAGSIQQFTASSAQFAVGLSDPGQWQLGAGEKADPGVIPGAFSDANALWNPYQATASPGVIDFASSDGQMHKTYRLEGRNLRVEYHTNQPIVTAIPLALGGNGRFSPGWSKVYGSSVGEKEITWGMRPILSVGVETSGKLSIKTFLDSAGYLKIPENPDRNYPAGHFLPFPLAEVDVSGSGSFTIDLSFSP